MTPRDGVLITLPHSNKPWTLFRRKEFIVAFSEGVDHCAIFRADGEPTDGGDHRGHWPLHARRDAMTNDERAAREWLEAAENLKWGDGEMPLYFSGDDAKHRATILRLLDRAQDARDAALEEAAQTAENFRIARSFALTIAAAIRALKEPKP